MPLKACISQNRASTAPVPFPRLPLGLSLAQVRGDWIDKVSREILASATEHGLAHDTAASRLSRTVFPAADFVTIAGARTRRANDGRKEGAVSGRRQAVRGRDVLRHRREKNTPVAF